MFGVFASGSWTNVLVLVNYHRMIARMFCRMFGTTHDNESCGNDCALNHSNVHNELPSSRSPNNMLADLLSPLSFDSCTKPDQKRSRGEHESWRSELSLTSTLTTLSGSPYFASDGPKCTGIKNMGRNVRPNDQACSGDVWSSLNV